MPKPRIAKETFEALAVRAGLPVVVSFTVETDGLPLTPVQKTELYEAYSYVEAMAERVRAGGKRAPLAEPATIFKARG